MALEAKKRIAQVVTIESVTPGKSKGGPYYEMDVWIMELRMPDFGRYPVKNMQIPQPWAVINSLAKDSSHDAVLEQGNQKENNDGSRNYHFFWNVVGWDGDGVSEVLPWDGGEPAEIPPTDEAKERVSHDAQPDGKVAPSRKPQYGWTDILNEQIKWGEAVKLGVNVMAVHHSTCDAGDDEAMMVEYVDRFAHQFYRLLGRGPQAPTTPVEPQKQGEPTDGVPPVSPTLREATFEESQFKEAQESWREQQRGPSDFKGIDFAKWQADLEAKSENAADATTPPVEEKPQPNPAIAEQREWGDKVWGPLRDATRVQDASYIRQLGDEVVKWDSKGAYEDCENMVKGEKWTLEEFSAFVIPKALEYIHEKAMTADEAQDVMEI